MPSEPIIIESLNSATSQYLAQIQQDLNLDSSAQAIQHILEESRQRNTDRTIVDQLSDEHRSQLIKMMVGLEQCQTWLSQALLTLHILTTPSPVPKKLAGQPKRRKAKSGPRARKQNTQPINVPRLSIDQLQRGVTGSVLAARLGVSAATVSRKRSDVNFNEWSQERDPAGISWIYSGSTRRFHPGSLPSEELSASSTTLENLS